MRSILVLGCLLTAATVAQGQTSTAQHIPGKVECELYNNGGEGKAYHDSDAINNGSGKLNPADGSFLNEFRMKEGVDISYTKEKNIDNTIYNKVQPEIGKLYVGWTVPGEWIRYDVIADESATYTVTLMYTAHDNGTFTLDFDGKEALLAHVPSTFDASDTVAWRQWHHWNKVDLGEIKVKKGKHVLTLSTQTSGNMNYDFLEFKKKD